MKLQIDRADLEGFLDEAQVANVVYYRVRRELFDRFAAKLHGRPSGIRVSYETFSAIRGFCQARNDQVTSDSRYAFERALADLDRALTGSVTTSAAPSEADTESPGPSLGPGGPPPGGRPPGPSPGPGVLPGK